MEMLLQLVRPRETAQLTARADHENVEGSGIHFTTILVGPSSADIYHTSDTNR